jgi:hypothetical protein
MQTGESNSKELKKHLVIVPFGCLPDKAIFRWKKKSWERVIIKDPFFDYTLAREIYPPFPFENIQEEVLVLTSKKFIDKDLYKYIVEEIEY